MEKVFKNYVFKMIPGLEGKYSKLLQKFFKIIPTPTKNNGIKILEEDWDYLIILDACRYDYFKKYNFLSNGKLYKSTSCASSTTEWIKKNFYGKHCYDIVYVNANPFISPKKLQNIIGNCPFHHIENVWRDGWNETIGTVMPQDVTNRAFLCLKKYPNKRMIIHYMQPHEPFITDPSLRRYRFINTRENQTNKRIREGYKKNLMIAMKEVKRLTEYLEGKIVVTADHGDMFGKYFVSGHPGGVYFKDLVEVPWFVIEKKSAKNIEPEKEATKTKIRELKKLGKI